MYNRYIPPDITYSPIVQEDDPTASDASFRSEKPGPSRHNDSRPPPRPSEPTRGSSSNDLLGGITQEAGKLLGGLFKNVSLENLDTGDILLILIILFLFLEGDNLDLVIALGLMLLLSLGEQDSEGEKKEPDSSPHTIP